MGQVDRKYKATEENGWCVRCKEGKLKVKLHEKQIKFLINIDKDTDSEKMEADGRYHLKMLSIRECYTS